jgi:hypothetical protein
LFESIKLAMPTIAAITAAIAAITALVAAIFCVLACFPATSTANLSSSSFSFANLFASFCASIEAAAILFAAEFSRILGFRRNDIDVRKKAISNYN